MKKSELQQIIREEILAINENLGSYMFFQNLRTIRDAADEMLKMDVSVIDMILSDGHDWANDHISTSKDDVEEVYNFLKSSTALTEKKAVGKQKFIAKQAEPKDEITAADFAKLRSMKKKK